MAKKPATVAVVTRTKNREILLDRAIRSVMQQTLDDLHMVIVNDGGDPGPVDDLVKGHQDIIEGRVTVVHHPESKGMEAASNAGIRAVDSRYVTLLDDDDSWHPTFLERTTRQMAESGNPGVVTATRIFVERVDRGDIRLLESLLFNQVVYEDQESDDETGVIDWSREPEAKVTDRVRELNTTRLRPTSLLRLLATNQWPVNSFVYSREVLDVIGYYDESLPVLGDWDFNLRFFRNFDVDYIDEDLAYYHHRQLGSGALGNTVNAEDRSHERGHEQLINRYLREDLERGSLGMGFLTNLMYHERGRSGYFQAFYDDLMNTIAEEGEAREELAASIGSVGGVLGWRIGELDRHVSRFEDYVNDALSTQTIERRAKSFVRGVPRRAAAKAVRTVHPGPTGQPGPLGGADQGGSGG